MIRNSIITLLLVLGCVDASAFMPADDSETSVTQNIMLKSGWNWISFNVQDDAMLSLKALKDASVTYIASRSDFLLYDDVTKSWYGSLAELVPTEGYSVYATKADTITLTGVPYNVEETAVTIHTGWNWIGYLPRFTQYAANALSNYPATKGDRVVDISGLGVTYATSWTGSFSMQSGSGYHFFSNAASERHLAYNTNGDAEDGDTIKGGDDSEFIEIGDSTNHFDAKAIANNGSQDAFDNSKYESDRFICTNVYIDGEPLTDPSGYNVIALVKGEHRGVSTVSGTAAGKAFFIVRAWGNSNEKRTALSFLLCNNNTGKEYVLSNYNTTYYFYPDSKDGTPGDAIHLYARTKNQTDIDITVNKGDDIYELLYARVDSLSRVTGLTLRGDCSDINYNILCSLVNLEKLDLSHANGFNFNSNGSNYKLKSLTKLHTILLPATVTYIPSYYFYYCTSLKSVTLLSFMPPSLNTNAFPDNVDTLHVTHFAHPKYVQWDSRSIFTNLLADQAEPDPSQIYINGTKSVIYTQEMADAKFTPDVTVAENAKFDLYGEAEATLGNVSLSNAASFIPHMGGTAKSASTAITKGYSNSWTFFTLPFDAKVSDITRSSESFSWVIRKYNSQQRATGVLGENWTDVSYNETLHAGQGYILGAKYVEQSLIHSSKRKVLPWPYSATCDFIFNSTAATSSNVLISTDRSVVVQDYNNAQSTEDNWNWNLIGNPYPSYFNIAYIDYQAPIQVYDGSKYVAYSPLDDYYVLSPGQAFFVQTNGQNSITFAQQGRCHSCSDRPYGLAKAETFNNGMRKVVNITLSNGSADDRTRVVDNPAAKQDYEIGRDMAKMSDGDAAVELFSLGGDIRYTIDERPQIEGIRIGYTAAQADLLTLSSDSRMVIEDKQAGLFTEIGGDDTYEFSTQAGTFTDRFLIHEAGTTGIESVNSEQSTVNNGACYNIAGQRVTSSSKGFVISNGKKVVK